MFYFLLQEKRNKKHNSLASKKIILKEIQIVITNPFETPQKVFDFFDKGGNDKISKNSK